MVKQGFPITNRKSVILLILLTPIIILAIWRRCGPFPTVDKVSRVVTNPSNVTIVDPKDVGDVVSAVRFAKKNGMKVTALGGGHSYYYMRDFPKLQSENLMVIDTKNMRTIKYLEENDRVFFEAGVKAREIRAFNRQFSSKWCIHGDCDGVGIGFWISGGQYSGIEGGWAGICGTASDYIRKISYVDSNGDQRSVTDVDSNVLKALRMIGGEFGIVTSIEAELVPVKPRFAAYVVDFDRGKAKSLFKSLMEHTTFRDRSVNIQFALFSKNRMLIVIYYDPQRWCGDFEHILTQDFNLKINSLMSRASNMLLGNSADNRPIGWDKLQYLYHQRQMRYGTWTENDWTFLYDKEGADVVDKIIDMYDGSDVIWLVPKSYASLEIKRNNPYTHPLVTIDYTTLETPSPQFLHTKRMVDELPLAVRYLNLPSKEQGLEKYFSPLSPLSLQELREQKQTMDPNGMFVTRFNLSGQ